MTDREMLLECFDAVRALDTAKHANLFLKSRGVKHLAWSGTGQHKLRTWIVRQLENHFLEQQKAK